MKTDDSDSGLLTRAKEFSFMSTTASMGIHSTLSQKKHKKYVFIIINYWPAILIYYF